MNRDELSRQLHRVLAVLWTLEQDVVDVAEAQGIDPLRILFATGEPMLAPLIVARTHALVALAQLDVSP